MIVAGWLGCAPALRRPEWTFGPASAVVLVHPSADPLRWYVPVRVEGLGPALWLVDTGYTNTTCDDDLARILQLDVAGRTRSVGETGKVEAGRARLPPFTLGGHTIERVTCLVRDLAATSSVRSTEEQPVIGVLGMDVLSRATVTFDPGAAELRLEPPGGVAAGVRAKVAGGRSPRVRLPVEVEGQRTWMLLDTGTSSTWIDGRRRGWSPTRVVEGGWIVGTGGASRGPREEYDVDGVTLADVPLGPLTALGRDAGPLRPDLLGLDALRRVVLTLDATHRRVMVAPAAPAPIPPWDPARPVADGIGGPR